MGDWGMILLYAVKTGYRWAPPCSLLSVDLNLCGLEDGNKGVPAEGQKPEAVSPLRT